VQRPEHVPDQLFLVPVAQVQGALADAGLLGHGLERERPPAAGGERLDGRGRDPVPGAGVPGTAPAGRAVTVLAGTVLAGTGRWRVRPVPPRGRRHRTIVARKSAGPGGLDQRRPAGTGIRPDREPDP